MTIQVELMCQSSFKFSIRRNEMINYDHINIYLYTLVNFYYYKGLRNVIRPTQQIYVNLVLRSENYVRLHIKFQEQELQ